MDNFWYLKCKLKRKHKIEKVKIDCWFKKQKKLAKTAITLYNMIENLKVIGEVYE